ncbi:hypothetical protein ABIA30_002463 [Mycobacterium sp. MAA66]|uniref:hypothetical protein n=1 Tax=Mycobacterium sp. MAA66 TaxID=3156297 RepID=UPI0035150269
MTALMLVSVSGTPEFHEFQPIGGLDDCAAGGDCGLVQPVCSSAAHSRTTTIEQIRRIGVLIVGVSGPVDSSGVVGKWAAGQLLKTIFDNTGWLRYRRPRFNENHFQERGAT